MPMVATYHTISKEYSDAERAVYHDKDNCPDGKRILDKHRERGAGDKPHCKECSRSL